MNRTEWAKGHNLAYWWAIVVPKVDKLKADVWFYYLATNKNELMGRALDAKLQFNDLSHPERGFRCRNRPASSHGASLSFP